MWLARFLIDVILSIGIITLVISLFGTGLDLIGKLSRSINKMIRKIFRLDDDSAWNGPKTEYKDRF